MRNGGVNFVAWGRYWCTGKFIVALILLLNNGNEIVHCIQLKFGQWFFCWYRACIQKTERLRVLLVYWNIYYCRCVNFIKRKGCFSFYKMSVATLILLPVLCMFPEDSSAAALVTNNTNTLRESHSDQIMDQIELCPSSTTLVRNVLPLKFLPSSWRDHKRKVLHP